MIITKRIVVLVALLSLLAAGCNRPEHQGKVLATVNGAPITDVDLELTAIPSGHGTERPKHDLDYVIAEELFYQQGQKLGLDQEPGYRKQLARLEQKGHGLSKDSPGFRQYVAHEMRGEMARRIFDSQIAAKVDVRLPDAREYFEKHKERISTELHLGLIQFPSRGAALQAQQKLRKGESFEALAAEQRKKEPEAPASHDLGFVKWQQLPIDYTDSIYKLKPGEVSALLGNSVAGYELIKMYGSRKSAKEVRFEDVSGSITNRLRDLRLIEEYYKYLERLKKEAKIVTF